MDKSEFNRYPSQIPAQSIKLMINSANFEIERKFLVKNLDWKSQVNRTRNIKQVYVCVSDGWLTRLRIYDEAEAEITLKGPQKGKALGCPEFNLPMPIDDAMELWNQSGDKRLEKVRNYVPSSNDGLTWEVDEFKGLLDGLIMAEIELPTAETPISIPAWIACEVSRDMTFNNLEMATSMATLCGVSHYKKFFHKNIVDTLAKNGYNPPIS